MQTDTLPPPRILRLGTRGSQLALTQTRMVTDGFLGTGVRTRAVTIHTSGDRIRKPLAEFGGKALFAKEIEEALLAGEIDIAVHSLKDLPAILPRGLRLAAVLEREAADDALVLPAGTDMLPATPRIGTCSVRRGAEAQRSIAGARILPLRGNVETRLGKLDAGEFDALILSAAGLIRLGLQGRIHQLLTGPAWQPALGQGAIGLEIREDDVAAAAACARINHEPSFLSVLCERGFQSGLEGTCHSPIAGRSAIREGVLHFTGEVIAPDGSDQVGTEFSVSLDGTEADRSKVVRAARRAGQELRPKALPWLG